MDWIITEENQLSSQDIDRQGNKLLIGNGHFGYRGTLEEYTKDQKTATIVSGLYDKVGDQWREPVNLPNGGFVQVSYKGEILHALTGKIISHTQSVNMHSAIHERQTTFETADGTHITLYSRRFASLSNRHLLCMEYTIKADRHCEVDILTGIDANVWDINGPHLREFSANEMDEILLLQAVTHENAVPIAISEALRVKNKDCPIDAAWEKVNRSDHSALRLLRSAQVKDGFTFEKYICLVTGLDSDSPLETCRRLCQQASSKGFTALLEDHMCLWSQRWQACDIQIDGDPEAQRALRFSLYHLLSIAPAHTDRASIPARGMSGQMYKGAVFWDTEIFMLPFFTHIFPDLARRLLLYRFHTLEGARRKAEEYGYRGAFYAWESQDTGDDACTLFNVTDVLTNRPVRTFFRDKQVHISADVVYAFWQYFKVTGDSSIWFEGGAEVIFECARFFLSYLYYNLDKRRYEILDVTGADEYHERVHNNAFTNRMVAHTFEICQRVAEELNRSAPDYFKQLVDALDFKPDLDLIREIAPLLYRPDIRIEGGLIPQFDGYFALDDPTLNQILAQKLHPNEYLGGGNGLATTTQIIKQADVVLMLFLFGEDYPLDTKSTNWEYYEPRTEHGSSLSACSYSLIAAELGKTEQAYRYFTKTATIDLDGDGREYVGTLYIGGTHPASNGGAWMSVVFGLCGIQCSGDVLLINPHLPIQWKKVGLTIIFRNQPLRITISKDGIAVKPIKPLVEALSVSSGNSIYPMHSTGELNIPSARGNPVS